MSALTEPGITVLETGTTPRVDLYATIHKGLRMFMGDTLARVGRVDLANPAELDATLGQLEALLDICRNHLAHENQFVHPAIEARCPGTALRIEGEHEEHLDAIAALAADAVALRVLPTAAAAHRLYRHLALFVGENLIHMNVEETSHNAALWAAYVDSELLDIHTRLVASIEPAEMAVVLRWMVPAITPVERAELLDAMQQQMPSAAMHGVLEIVASHLDDKARVRLARSVHAAVA